MRDLSGAQIRQLIDTEHVYVAFREAQRDYRQRFAGSMAWKTVTGRRYLYRKTGNAWKSLGPKSEQTEEIHERFHSRRDAAKARRASLDTQINALAPVNRAMRLGRVPWMAARILRRIERDGLLGQGFRVAGTHALYAYERMGGVHFASDAVATTDIDLLYDARGSLDLVASGLGEIGLIGALRALDASFAPTAPGSFRAVNDTGFMVDLITPATRNPATRQFRRSIGNPNHDLTAVEIAGLTWLESSPAIEQIVIDERGYPLTIVAPDPRAFVAHKMWLSQRDDRDPAKKRRDAAQAHEVAAMLVTYLPGLKFDDQALDALPIDVRKLGIALASAIAMTRPQDAAWDE